MNFKYGLILIVLLSLLLSACVGDSEDGQIPPNRPSSLIEGRAVDAAIKKGLIEVFPFGNTSQNFKLASVQTDNNGFYNLTLAIPSQAITIRLSNGCYIEEYTSTEICLSSSQYLYASTYYESGTPLTIMVTPFTTLAHGLAECKVDNGVSDINAIAESVSAVSSIFTFDILSTYPVSITEESSLTRSITDRHFYGFLTASFSVLTAEIDANNPHSTYTSIGLVQLLYEDVRSDCLFDGHGLLNNTYRTPLAYGPKMLDANTYRSEISRSVLNIASNQQLNKTGLSTRSLMSLVSSVSSSTHEAFSNYPTKPIDMEGPTITAGQSSNLWYSEEAALEYAFFDFVGLERVLVDVDGVDYEEYDIEGSEDNLILTMITSNYEDGDHIIGIKAFDLLNNETYKQFPIRIDNSGPSANIKSERYTNSSIYTVIGTFQDFGVGIESISVNDVDATINTSDNTFSATIDLSLGNNWLSIVAIDALGNSFTDSSNNVVLDVVPPTIDTNHSFADFILSNGTIFQDNLKDNNDSWPLYVSTGKTSLSGVPINPNSMNTAEIPWFGLYISDPNQTGTESQPESLTIEYRYEKSNQVIIDWTDVKTFTGIINDQVPVYLPIVTELLGEGWFFTVPSENHTISVRATDLSGNTKTIELIFRIETYVPEFSFTRMYPTLGHPFLNGFNNRTDVFGLLHEPYNYDYTNVNDFPVLISVEDNSVHDLTNKYQSAIRENRARLVSDYNWRGWFYYRYNSSWHLAVPYVNNVDSVFTVSGTYNLSTQAYLYDLFLHDYLMQTDPGYAGGTPKVGTPYFTPLQKPSQEFGEYSNILTDNPIPPPPSDWQNIDPANGSNYHRVNSVQLASGPFNQDFTLNYAVDYVHNDPILGDIPVKAYAKTIMTQNNPPINVNDSTLEQKVFYSYQTQNGYPRNNLQDHTKVVQFNTKSIVVKDEKGIITPVNGFYRVNPNSTVTISKQVEYPTIDTYNDTEVGNMVNFSSYVKKYYDKQFIIRIDTSIVVNSVMDMGYEFAHLLKPRKLSYTPSSPYSTVQTSR